MMASNFDHARERDAADLRVSILGYGAIGSSVAHGLNAGQVAGAHLEGVITRESSTALHSFPRLSLGQAIERSNLIIECAGTEAVASAGPQIIDSGTNLMLSSIGALADPALREALLKRGPGSTVLTTGAVGGLDLLAAAAHSGGLNSVVLTTTKKSSTLVQPWMTPSQAEDLHKATSAVTLFEGDVYAAIELFPKSLNVAVALAVATDLWSQIKIRMIADPNAALTHHSISASGPSGNYSFSISNLPHEANPATSKLVPAAILSGLSRLANPSGTFV